MNAIEVSNIKKSFSDKEVLKGVNLSIQKGEIFGFLGRNGAGKSTFINILTGISYKTSGTATVLGLDQSEINSYKKKIGVMPDVTNLYQHMTALNFMKYMSSLKKVKISKKDIISLLNKVGLYEVEKQKIKSFSFGMKKKICIAQALIGSPEILILDEPTSGLDPESSIEIQKLIMEIKETGTTIFLTSHSLNEIERMSDRIAIMHEGRIVKLGTVKELKKDASEHFSVSIRTEPTFTGSLISKFNSTSSNNFLNFKGNENGYSVLESNSERVIPEFIEFLIKNEFKVFEVNIKETSLEEIFLAV